MRVIGLLPLVAALLIGCGPAAAQGVQRAYLPLAQLREGAPASPAATASPTATPAGLACAADRLPVRTLSDPEAGQVASWPVTRSIRELRETAAPTALDAATPRLDRIERSTFQLQVEIVGLSRLESGALALTVADPADPALTALVELPDPACAAVAASPRAAAVAAARDALTAGCGVRADQAPIRLYGQATIAGVGFFAPGAAPVGAAANGLLLSPVLSFASGDCNPFGPVDPTATATRRATAVVAGATPTPLHPSATPSPTRLPATAVPSPTRTVAPTATPTPPTTITFAGADSRRSPTYRLGAGRWRFDLTYGGSTSADAYVLAGGVNQGYFARCQSACTTGATLTLAGGNYTVQVVTVGAWSVTIRPA